MTNTIADELRTVTADLLHVLSTFPEDSFNAPGKNRGWSAAQVADHLFRSDYSMLRSLYGASRPCGRPPDQHVQQIRELFLDTGTRLKSPDPVVPGTGYFNKETLLLFLQATRAKIYDAADHFKLDEVCLFVEVEAFANHTRLEILHFILYHTHRHIHQLHKLKDPARTDRVYQN